MVITVVIGEAAAALWMRLLPFQLAPLTVGVLCVGAVALTASLIYDGCD